MSGDGMVHVGVFIFFAVKWRTNETSIIKKSFDFTFTWWADWSSSGDGWSATLNSVAGVGLLRRIYQQTHNQGAAINTWIIYVTNTVLLIMLSAKFHPSDGNPWQGPWWDLMSVQQRSKDTSWSAGLKMSRYVISLTDSTKQRLWLGRN